MCRWWGAFLWCSLWALSSASAAQYREERTEVVGVRQRGAAHDTVTFIDRQRIAQLGAWSVPELLRYVPGLDVVRTGGLAGQTSLFLRGGNSNHTLVLVDGVRVNDPVTGLAELSLLPAEEIERIEVVRGAQGVMYGTDAMGGVVEIHTRGAHRRRGLHAETSVAAGSHRSHRQDAHIAATSAASMLDLKFSRSRAGGFSSAAPAPGASAEADGYRASAANLRWSHAPTPDARWELGLRNQSSRTDIEGFMSVPPFAPEDDPDYVQWDRSWQGDISLAATPRPGWNQHLRAGAVRHRRVNRNGALGGGGGASDQRATHAELEWVHDWQERLSLGLQARWEQVADRRTGLRRAQGRRSTWIETVLGPVRAGVRHEWHDEYGGQTVWRVGVHRRVASAWGLRAQMGTAQRAPGLTELYGPFGNPKLRPERSLGLDLATTYLGSAGRMELALYYQRYRDLLRYELRGGNFLPLNVGKASSRGLELSMAGHLRPQVQVHLNYTYNRARNEILEQPLARRPRHKFNAGVTASRPALGLDATLAVRHVGTRVDSDFSGLRLASHTLADAVFGWRVWPEAQLRLRVENLAGRDYQEVAGYAAPGRTFYIGLRYTPTAGNE